jgi:hypothetical protein
VAVIAHDIVGPTPEDEAVVQFDPHHFVGRHLELTGHPVARSTGR